MDGKKLTKKQQIKKYNDEALATLEESKKFIEKLQIAEAKQPLEKINEEAIRQITGPEKMQGRKINSDTLHENGKKENSKSKPHFSSLKKIYTIINKKLPEPKQRTQKKKKKRLCKKNKSYKNNKLSSSSNLLFIFSLSRCPMFCSSLSASHCLTQIISQYSIYKKYGRRKGFLACNVGISIP